MNVISPAVLTATLKTAGIIIPVGKSESGGQSSEKAAQSGSQSSSLLGEDVAAADRRYCQQSPGHRQGSGRGASPLACRPRPRTSSRGQTLAAKARQLVAVVTVPFVPQDDTDPEGPGDKHPGQGSRSR